ncbi:MULTISPECIES: bacteriophage protein [Brenneria]|uniref:HEPN domain-containing protein n=1 Tax=Brenneria nigrifluens DSM 30175 = ATCC 13028 TaxID=1121120 RepID=A0A2U1UUQ1_9GAMM|nr:MULTISPECIES: bacteriophage protein [Brenneria]EHD22070.1 putative bacteriophage protein [Brenneria sp. EniD312]MCL2899787.1 hypothetical protein [Brenneria tiliae]MCL2904724.1 hypothetical protein [Brenneria tiliae]PWC25399.1 hypothetical protein DDT54_05755 [Brenneria nigrifluens DSM 30175 = ATCC 13028]QCR05150.1 hypothetical protein EH206_13715 [Brenneria nigrifluens DSM 30175 = ATCC 13028]
MPVSRDCFLDIAKDSLKNSGEQWTRNAISRSYYFMFHSVKSIIIDKAPDRDKAGNRLPFGEHKRLSEYLCSGDAAEDYSLDGPTAEKIGMKLRSAHQKRCDADYALEKKINRIDALKMVVAAEEVARDVDSLSKP